MGFFWRKRKASVHIGKFFDSVVSELTYLYISVFSTVSYVINPYENSRGISTKPVLTLW